MAKYYTLHNLPGVAHYSGGVEKRSWNIELTAEFPFGAEDSMGLLEEILEEAYTQVLATIPPGAMALLTAINKDFHKTYISTGRALAANLKFDALMTRLEAVLQSSTPCDWTQTSFSVVLSFPAGQEHPPQQEGALLAGARYKSLKGRAENDIRLFTHRKRCIINPLTSRFRIPEEWKNMCLPLAILHGAHRALNTGLPGVDLFGRFQSIGGPAMQLVRLAGFEDRLGPFSLEEAESFHKALPRLYPQSGDWQLCLYTTAGPPEYHWGSPDAANAINIFISRNDGMPIKDIQEDMEAEFHADLITSMPAFMGNYSFCRRCFKGTNNKDRDIHRCEGALCKLCKKINCTNRNNDHNSGYRPIKCTICNFAFCTQACKTAHETSEEDTSSKKNKATDCDKRRRCDLCGQLGSKEDIGKHLCGRPKCAICGVHHLPQELKCFISKPQLKGQDMHAEQLLHHNYQEQSSEQTAEQTAEQSSELQSRLLGRLLGGRPSPSPRSASAMLTLRPRRIQTPTTSAPTSSSSGSLRLGRTRSTRATTPWTSSQRHATRTRSSRTPSSCGTTGASSTVTSGTRTSSSGTLLQIRPSSGTSRSSPCACEEPRSTAGTASSTSPASLWPPSPRCLGSPVGPKATSPSN